jgi:hypothetical protein
MTNRKRNPVISSLKKKTNSLVRSSMVREVREG